MKSIVTILTLATLLTAAVARAEERCAVPMTDWQPRQAVDRLAAENGWTVRRIRIDDGCYEIIGLDAEGRPIEVKVDPGTLAIVEFEFETDHGDRPEHGGKEHEKSDD